MYDSRDEWINAMEILFISAPSLRKNITCRFHSFPLGDSRVQVILSLNPIQKFGGQEWENVWFANITRRVQPHATLMFLSSHKNIISR